jgi:hypothetical protein
MEDKLVGGNFSKLYVQVPELRLHKSQLKDLGGADRCEIGRMAEKDLPAIPEIAREMKYAVSCICSECRSSLSDQEQRGLTILLGHIPSH